MSEKDPSLLSTEELENILSSVEPDPSELTTDQLKQILKESTNTEEPVLNYEEPKPEEYSFVENVPRYAAQTARHIAAGIGDVPDIVHLPNNLYEVGKHFLNKDHKPDLKSFGYGEKIGSSIDELTNYYTKPQTSNERMFESGVRAVSGMGPAGIIGKGISKGANILAKFAKTPANVVDKAGKFVKAGTTMTPGNIGGTAGGAMAAQSAFEADPEDYEKALLAGLLGSTGGQMTPAILGKTLKEAAMPNKLAGLKDTFLKVNPEKLKSFRESNITPGLGDISDSATIKTAQKAAQRNVAAEHPINEIYGKRKSEVLSNLDLDEKNVMTKMQIGDEISNSIKKVRDNAKKVSKEIEEKAFENIIHPKGKNKVNVNNTLEEILKTENYAKTLEPELQEDFFKSPYWKEVSKIKTSAERNNGFIPYDSLNTFRKKIGDLAEFDQIPSSEQAQFNKLYGKMKVDLENFFDLQGGEISKNYKKYKEHWHQWKSEIEPKLNQLLKADMNGDMTVFKNLYNNLKDGGYKFDIITSGMNPEQKLKFSKGILYHMGTNREGIYNPSQMFTQYRGLPSEVQTTLKSGMPLKMRKTFEKMNDAFEHIKDTEKYGNFSGTESMAHLNRTAGELIEGLKQTMHGNYKPMLGKAVSFFMSYGGSKGLLTNQKFMDTMGYLVDMRNKSQVPVFINKVKKNLGIDAKMAKDKSETTLSKKLSSNILKSVVQEGSKMRVNPYENMRLTPDGYWVPEDVTDEQYFRDKKIAQQRADS